jgi:predicted nucleotidyltransferase component of viral defense system
MKLQHSVLQPEARVLFEALATTQEMSGFTMVGGTALALQIGHRISLDFDFAQFQERLNGFVIDQVISQLKYQGFEARIVTSPAEISQFKINSGVNLLDYARDYVINDVKVTFFTLGRNEQQRQYYQASEKFRESGLSFDLLGIEGLKAAKTLVLADRIRSRDLYDLFVLIREHGYTIKALFDVVRSIGVIDDPEYYKAILTGKIPLDEDDEGLEAIGVNVDDVSLYEYFDNEIAKYEIEFAKQYFLNK